VRAVDELVSDTIDNVQATVELGSDTIDNVQDTVKLGSDTIDNVQATVERGSDDTIICSASSSHEGQRSARIADTITYDRRWADMDDSDYGGLWGLQGASLAAIGSGGGGQVQADPVGDTISYTGAIARESVRESESERERADMAARREDLRQLQERILRMRVEIGALRVGPGSQETVWAIVRSFESDLQSLARTRSQATRDASRIARQRREPGAPPSDGAGP
jgi:hypothetical protein